MSPPHTLKAMPAGRDIAPAAWQQTPPSVQTLGVTVLGASGRFMARARLTQDSTPSQRPPSTDLPSPKARQPAGDAPPRKAGGSTRSSWPSAVSLGPNRDTGAHAAPMRLLWVYSLGGAASCPDAARHGVACPPAGHAPWCVACRLWVRVCAVTAPLSAVPLPLANMS